MLENENSSTSDVSHFKPAFDIAVEEVNNRVGHGGFQFHFEVVLRQTGRGCGKDGLHASAIAAQMLQNTSLKINAFFGPLCYKETVAVADLASYWNKPIFSAFDTNPVLLNNDRFKTLVRMSHSRFEVAEFVSKIYEHFHWEHACAILWDIQNTEWTDLVESIREELLKTEIHLYRVVISDHEGNIESAVDVCTGISRGKLIHKNYQHQKLKA